MKPSFHALTVRAIERLTDDSVAITFDVPEELSAAYRFLPGQHVAVRTPLAGDDVRRSYSICSVDELRVAVKRLPGGAFSSMAIDRLRVGDEIDVMTPTGRFGVTVDPDRSRHIVCVAAGSGITPIRSIVEAVLRFEPRSRATLLYGNRTTASVMFGEELHDLKDRYPSRFQLVHVLSRELSEIELFAGRIDGAKLRWFLDTVLACAEVDEWYLCGPQPMVADLRAVLLERGVPRAAVRTELFHVGPLRSTTEVSGIVERSAIADEAGVDSCEVTAVLDGRGSTFRLPREGVSVLEGVLGVRTDAPFACRGGVCGTCRARIIEGEVSMDQCYALEPEEVAAGYALTCQSHPTTDRIVVDYDT
ncbi:MAG TPA: 1,2-phenylacetyl-CoA epoxidase subunit PaaE [Actinopolymorphaceae bacterium]